MIPCTEPEFATVQTMFASDPLKIPVVHHLHDLREYESSVVHPTCTENRYCDSNREHLENDASPPEPVTYTLKIRVSLDSIGFTPRFIIFRLTVAA